MAAGLFLPSPAVAAEQLRRCGVPAEYLYPDGGYISGWVAVGNNGVPNEVTKSYRLVLSSAFSKEAIQGKLNPDELRRIGMGVEDWEWRNPLADPFANRGSLKASDDAGRSLELAYSGADGFGAEGGSQAFRDLNNKVAEVRGYHNALQREAGGGGAIGRSGQGRSGHSSARGFGRY